MSDTVPAKLKCPHCKTIFEIEIFYNLNMRRRPGIRQQILDEHFQQYSCPACNRQVQAAPIMLYTDFQRRQWYALFPEAAFVYRSALASRVLEGFDSNMRENCPPMVKAWASHFEVRLAFGVPALREKLIAFDANIDDRILEVFKLQLMRDTKMGSITPTTNIFLHSCSEHTLQFLHINNINGGMEVVHQVETPRSGLEQLGEHLSNLESSMPSLFNSPVVHWRAPLVPDLPMDVE